MMQFNTNGHAPAAEEEFDFSSVNWGVQGNEGFDGNGGDYVDWVGLMREILRPRFDTIEDFLPDAIIKDTTHRSLMVKWIELGKKQLHAPVNNRREALDRIKKDISILNHVIDTSEIPSAMPDGTSLSLEMQETCDYLTISMAGDDTVEDGALPEKLLNDLKKKRTDLRLFAERLYRGMQRDKELGQFRDYLDLKLMMEDMVKDPNPNVAGATLRLPSMLSKAFTEARATETNTRRAHAQAVASRQLDVRGAPDAIEYMKAQASRARASARPRRRDDD